MPGRILAIARNDLRIVRHDAFPAVLLVVVPLIGMVFMKSAFRSTLLAEGVRNANGAEQAVPGMAVTFGFLLVSYVGYGFYREHAWKTWERLRASPASTFEIAMGKVSASLLLAALQFLLLFGVGGILFGLHVRGSWLALAAVAIAFGVFLVAAGLAVTAICRTVMQANTIAYLGTVLFSCLAGALVPESSLPQWAKAISPAIPSYWAMRGYRLTVLGKGTVALPVAVLLVYAVALAVVATLRMRFDDTKVGFA
jgi:ABC-2 type transport system permease protein